jgi:cystathionine beta-lyase/cystathionine gamma-synthase
MKRKEINSARVPVYRESGFELYDAETTAKAFKSEALNEREPDIYIYSRYRNPTVISAEKEIMKLEKSRWSLLTQSGMSAIDTALSIFQHGSVIKPWLFFTEIYGGTISYSETVLKKRRGLDIHTFSPVNGKYDLSEFEKIIKSLKPEVVYIETISNPMLIVVNVPKVAEIAGRYGSRVIVDNTFATPKLFRPLEYGVDIVVHSATKYFAGHGNITAGVICGNDDALMKSAIEYRKSVGHLISPDDAYRLQTQVMSFDLRFSRQCENAAKIALLLNRYKTVAKVYFPGLVQHETHHEAKEIFGNNGFGAMITFDFAGKNLAEKRKRRDLFIKNVAEKIKLIPTLGDPHTILMPVESVWGAKYPEPGMVRLSVGFENYSGLESTIMTALAKGD